MLETHLKIDELRSLHVRCNIIMPLVFLQAIGKTDYAFISKVKESHKIHSTTSMSSASSEEKKQPSTLTHSHSWAHRPGRPVTETFLFTGPFWQYQLSI